jgi:acyl-coenzyme A thioesterase PaaI-like protein
MWDFTEMSGEEVGELRRRYEPLTESIRELVDAALRTEVNDDVARSVTAEIDAAVAKLRSRQCDTTLGITVTPEGDQVPWGNVAEGPRNPFAPPLVVQPESPTRARLDVELGAAYEGATGHLHGGYAALVLDHVFGFVASYGRVETVAATGTISLRFQRPTRLGLVHAEAEIRRTEGRKIFLVGHIADAEGITVSAEAVFIALQR